MGTRKVLEEALELLEFVGWTKGAYTRNSEGVAGIGSDPDVASFCARGAIYRACLNQGESAETHRDALCILDAAVGRPVITWNDDPETTFSEVREVFKRAVGGLALVTEEPIPVAA